MTDHIFCRGRVRGFSFDAWLYGERIARAFWNADFKRNGVVLP